MSRAVVEQLEALLRRSFDGANTQSLLGNLTNVQADDWDWLPDGGKRTIRDIFEHAAVAKHIYAAFLFSDARPRWDDVHRQCRERADDDTAALVEWAREGHAAFMAGMAKLQDDDLAEVTTKWHGATDTKAEVIAVMIQHDCYHAGEINHLRALHQRRDFEE
jgi:uncharacterized damage-inducible protein DinB